MLGFLSSAWAWAKGIVSLPGNLDKVASIDKQLKLQQELAETKNRLQEVENELAGRTAIEKGRMFFLNNAMWAKDADGKVDPSPYCSRCFELHSKAVHLITHTTLYDGRDHVLALGWG